MSRWACALLGVVVMTLALHVGDSRAAVTACVPMAEVKPVPPMGMTPGQPGVPAVVCATPTVTVIPTTFTSVPVGGSFTAIVNVATPASPPGTTTLAFYAPSDPNCTGTPAPKTVPVAAGMPSPAFTPTTAGVYHFRATYSGDATNTAVTTACAMPLAPGAPVSGSSFTATALTPRITAVASPTVPAGGMISARATLAGAFNPGGTVIFKVYGNGDPGCASPPVGTSSAVPLASPATSSPSFTVAGAGTYRFVATYSGDGANTGAASSCADPAAAVTVTGPAGPAGPLTPGTPAPACDARGMANAIATALVASLTGAPGASFKTICSAGVRIVMRAKEIRPGNRGTPRRDGFTTIANTLTHSSSSGALPFSLNPDGLALRDYAHAHGRSVIVFAIVHVRPDPSRLSSEAIQIFSLS